MIHTRQQLIDWISENVKDRILQNAIRNGGRLEVLGGFNPLPTSSNNGWLVQVTSRANQIYLIAVAEDRAQLGRFYWFRAPYVEWDKWIGSNADRLIDGDMPELYGELKRRFIEDGDDCVESK